MGEVIIEDPGSVRLDHKLIHGVEPRSEPVVEGKFGRYSEGWEHTSPEGGPISSGSHNRFGRHEETVGRRIVGYRVSGSSDLSISVSSRSGVSGTSGIHIKDMSPPVIDVSGIAVAPSWKLFSFHGETSIVFPDDEFDPMTLGDIIDSVLAQSSAARLPRVDEWLRKKNEIDADIRDINSRIGQIIP